jgi:hypothetical protein
VNTKLKLQDLKGENDPRNLGIVGRIILKFFLRKLCVWVLVDSSGCYEHGKELSGCMNGGECLPTEPLPSRGGLSSTNLVAL